MMILTIFGLGFMIGICVAGFFISDNELQQNRPRLKDCYGGKATYEKGFTFGGKK